MKKFFSYNSQVVYHNLIAKSKLMGYAYMQSCIYFLDCLKYPCNMLKVLWAHPKFHLRFLMHILRPNACCDEINDS